MSKRIKYHYRQIWEKYYGPIPLDELGRPYDIHHVDGNKNNNDINNLKAVSIKEHYNIHFKQKDWGACKALSMRLNEIPLNEKADLSRKIHTGRKRTKETKQKISKALKGRVQSLEERKKRSKPRPGSGPQGPRSEETKQKMRKPRSEEAKNKYKKLTSICPYCGVIGHPTPMRLWHFDKCKSKKHDTI